jgi:FixJ family two-component response regulator
MRKSLNWLFASVRLPTETYGSADEFLENWRPSRPGCLLLDLRMPGMSGLALQQKLRDDGCEIPIIFMSAHGDVATAVRAMRGGAVEFLPKPFSEDALLERVRQAIQWDRSNREKQRQISTLQARLAVMTNREKDVLRGVVAGRSTREIATELSISTKTVEMHRANLMRKMHARSAADLVRMYFLAGGAEEASATS